MQQGEWKTIQVIEVGQTPKGRPTVKGAGDRDGLLVGNDVETVPRVGQTIEARVTTSEFNGKTMHWLNEWRLAANGAAVSEVPHAPTPDAAMRFISNVVGQAIQAGTIKTPSEIGPWAFEAQKVMESLTSEP